MKKNTKGITLVALVVTVIILLILAGVTISSVTGDRSIVNEAKDARNSVEHITDETMEDLSKLSNDVKEWNEDLNKYTTISGATTGEHTETARDYTWEKINKIAQAIANPLSGVTEETTEVKAIVDGEECILGIGDTLKVDYDGKKLDVRVLGFKHDDLVDTSVYGNGITTKKASISFEFMDCLGTHNMNGTSSSNSTNSNGWAATEMRKWLNGYTSSEPVQNVGINGIAKTIADNMGDNKDSSGYKYIKQVKKSYIKEYNNANSIYKDNDSTKGKNYAYDYLWLLAASEIFATGYQANAHAVAITTEGEQYKFYKDLNPTWNGSTQKLVKAGSSNCIWWLRSPFFRDADTFLLISGFGGTNYHMSYGTYYVAPGFSI